MKFTCGKTEADYDCEFLVAFSFEDKLESNIGKEADARYKKLCEKKAFKGKLLQVARAGESGKDVIVVGLGESAEFDIEFLRRGAALAYDMASATKASRMDVLLPEKGDERESAQAIAEGALIASHKLDKYKSEKDPDEKEMDVRVLGKDEKIMGEGLKFGEIMANAQNYTRELNENPANMINPKTFAIEAEKLSKKYSLKFEALDAKALEKAGMNGILAVGKGSVNPPMMLCIEYNSGKPMPAYAIVGKGITFDSGGISLKPPKSMHEMKYDKSGACIALGVLKAIAELGLPVRIIGIIPLAENMPSGSAAKPGDIIKMHSGKTVEILNTDAEGRVILGDALSYAAEKKPKAIIDVATLTGAIITCLGRHAIGLFSNDAKLAEKIKVAGNKTFERVWEMPLWKEYSEMVKGDFADIRNIGSETGEAGSITAAAFLKEFVGETKWAHLDIAGVECVAGKHPLIEKGATGTGTRLIIQSIIEMAGKV